MALPDFQFRTAGLTVDLAQFARTNVITNEQRLKLAGDAALLQAAFDELQNLSSEPIVRSSIWRTTPVDCPAGSPDFLNDIILIHWIQSHLSGLTILTA